MSQISNNGEDPLAKTLVSALEDAKKELVKFDERRKPLVDRVQKLERIVAEFGAGPLKSDNVDDSEIVLWVRDNSSEEERVFTPDVAKAFGGDGRGFARRLKRMAEQEPPMIDGNPHEGYYVEGYNHGESVPSPRSQGSGAKVRV